MKQVKGSATMPIDQQYLHSDITDKILTCVHQVFDTLGSGFSEKLYENALVLELKEVGLDARQQYPIKVTYRNTIIGEFMADLLV
ncbi:MAG: GxxExxY protein, partial [Bacillota bacterium]|nr:GxxExxY protein [Bacillota bacterium]